MWLIYGFAVTYREARDIVVFTEREAADHVMQRMRNIADGNIATYKGVDYYADTLGIRYVNIYCEEHMGE